MRAGGVESGEPVPGGADRAVLGIDAVGRGASGIDLVHDETVATARARAQSACLGRRYAPAGEGG